MIEFGSWNIRGLNDPIKQVEIKKIITAGLYFFDVIETKVKCVTMSDTLKHFFLLDGSLHIFWKC